MRWTMSTSNNKVDVNSYHRVLEKNLSLQSAIKCRLRELAQQKRKNRRQAAQLCSQLVVLSPGRLLGNAAVQDPANDCDWHLNFFRGKDSSTPEENIHTKQRRKVEKLLRENHTDPWSKPEIKLLCEIAPTAPKAKDGISPNYVVLAERYAHAAKKGKRGQLTQRSPRECEEAYNQHGKNELFSQQEHDKLIRIVETFLQDDAARVDWVDVGRQMGRSTWGCFHQYQKAKDKPQQPWTRLQDELLFKYVAALGPQAVVDGNEVNFLQTGLFRHKTKPQILTRINMSLLNPNLKHEPWNEEEERRLGICMKIYSDQADKAALLSGTHVHGRSGASVADKWNRSLNPAFSARPFTKQDDDALLRVFRENPRCTWGEIAQKFPDRSAHRLMNRFSEIATDKDILLRYGDSIGGAERAQNSEQDQELTEEAVELVVQVRKRKR